MTDFTFMVNQTSHMFITGPEVVKAVTHEEIDQDGLGGADIHHAKSGVCSGVFHNDVDALTAIRDFINYLPSSWKDPSPVQETTDSRFRDCSQLNLVVPDKSTDSYDITDVIKCIMDDDSWMEVQPRYAKNLVIGFGRLEGRTVGIVANQPKFQAGVLDVDSSCKGARFVRFLNAFNIP
eukprot:179083_1